MSNLHDILTVGSTQWLGGLTELAVADAPNMTPLVAFTSDNSVADGTVLTTYGGYSARIRDWTRINLAAFDVPPRARAALLGIRWEIRHVGDTDPGAGVEGSLWLYARVPGESVKTGPLPMDIIVAPGSVGLFVLVNQTAMFPDGDAVRSAQRCTAALIDRSLELSWGYRNSGSPDRSLTHYRMDIFLRGWMA